MFHFNISDDISSANTLPACFYTDAIIFNQLKDKVFAKSWQLIGNEDTVKTENSVYPFVFVEHFLEEPLVLSKDENGKIYCLSNVCTHRGNVLVNHSQRCKTITCSYHGKRFALNGDFVSMPECEGMKNFPSEKDNLPNLPLHKWKNFLFTSLFPGIDFDELIKPLEDRVGWMPFEK